MDKIKCSKQIKIIGSCILFALIVAYLVIVAIFGRNFDPIISRKVEKINGSWTYTCESVTETIQLPTRFDTVKGQTFTLTHVLTEDEAIDFIGFKSNHSAVKVYVGESDSTPYEWGSESSIVSIGNPDVWHIVNLGDNAAGKTLKIELTPSYSSTNTSGFTVYYGSQDSIVLMVAASHLWSSIPAIGIFLIALICLFVYFEANRRHRDVSSLSVFAGALFCFAGWMIASTDLPQFYFGHVDFFEKFGTVALLLSMTLMMIGITYEYKDRLLNSDSKIGSALYKISAIAAHLMMLNLIVQFALQAFKVIDFFQLVGLTFGLGVLIFAIVFAIALFIYVREKTGLNLYRLIIKSISLLGMVVCYVVAIFYFDPAIYVAMKWTIFFYALGTLGRLVASLFLAKESNVRLTTELSSAKQTIMINQIKPHFLYNALTAIKSMCAIDPKKAEESIVDFSTYLRSNISPLSQKPYIFFAQELNHIQSYLKIETLRFGEEKLRIVYDVKEKDFMVPPLTIEVLVENAVRHGLFKKVKGGTVTIASWSDEKNYYVVVKDDGIGFDTEILSVQNDSLGIRNVRYRLETLCQATLNFDSIIGEGTTVTVTFPKGINQEAARKYQQED